MRWLTILLVLSIAAPTLATEGVLEINQVCAAGPGCFSGDAAGFPVTIGASGSYRLTSKLTVPNSSTTAISVGADNVSIDLGGFSILGPNTCSVGAGGCSASGPGGGIVGSFAQGVSVHDGVIEGMGANGIELGFGARIERITARFNGSFGIAVGPGSVVLANHVGANGNGGMLLDRKCAYANNVILGDGLGPSVTFAFGVATATGGDVCDDKLCSGRGERRFYLTRNTFTGSQALAACTSGYHMASMFEILDPTALLYDRALGLTDGVSEARDNGDGPPTFAFGWIRTGYPAPGFSGIGQVNCNAYTQDAGGGTVASLVSQWDFAPTNTVMVSPWNGGVQACSSPFRVWCVQD